MNPKYCVYMSVAPFTRDNYCGITMAYFDNRTRLHRSSDISHKRRTMDKCHGTMLKRGFYFFMFAPLIDFGVHDPTRLRLRRSEVRGMLLLSSTLNTQGNALHGGPELQTLD